MELAAKQTSKEFYKYGVCINRMVSVSHLTCFSIGINEVICTFSIMETKMSLGLVSYCVKQ